MYELLVNALYISSVGNYTNYLKYSRARVCVYVCVCVCVCVAWKGYGAGELFTSVLSFHNSFTTKCILSGFEPTVVTVSHEITAGVDVVGNRIVAAQHNRKHTRKT